MPNRLNFPGYTVLSDPVTDAIHATYDELPDTCPECGVMNHLIEYRVRPVTRYIVTRYESGIIAYDGQVIPSRTTSYGEFDNEGQAFEIAEAKAFKEREDLGWPPGDERMQFAQRSPAEEFQARQTQSVVRASTLIAECVQGLRISGTSPNGVARSEP